VSGTDAHAQPAHAPPKIKVTSLYHSPKVTNPERLYGVKINENPSDRKSNT
jgi:hypothetical protein